MGILEDAGRSLIGSPKSAMLIIHDYRTHSNGALPVGVKTISDKLSTFGSSATVSDMAGSYSKKTFRVQFNPSELQVYASNPPVQKTDTRMKKGKKRQRKKHTEVAVKPSVDLTVPLIFDDVNIYDAFMLDKFAMGASASAVTNVATGIASLAGKKWTVQTEVEGLLAALRDEQTRNVTFTWADFTFTGQLSNINAQYTMFSVSGRPIRAKVTLRIHQEMDASYESPWLEAHEEVFGGDSSSLVKAAQKVGNLINLNL